MRGRMGGRGEEKGYEREDGREGGEVEREKGGKGGREARGREGREV